MAADIGFRRANKEPALRQRVHRHEAGHQSELIAQQPALVNLQQRIGNQAVQRLLSQGRLSSHGIVQAKPEIQRCGCGGSCSVCKGQEEELNVSAGMNDHVQRFWGDDEEEDGGSWLDDAADWVSDTASDVTDWAGGGSTSSSSSSDSDTSGGSWLDDASDWVSEKAGAAADWAGDTWNDWTGGGETDEQEDDDSWLPDWLPDIDIPFFDDDESEEEPLDPEDLVVEVEGDEGQAVCMSEEVGHGGGTSGGVSVSGLTKIDWSASTGTGSFLNPSIAQRKVGNKTVYDVSGKVHIDYTAPEPTVTFTVNPPMSQLNECKQEKVNAFKGPSGDLGKHEADHVAKLKSFDGSEEFDHTFTGLEASSTEELTEKVNAALNAVVQPKIKARQKTAQDASDNLDPWSKPIPGIASCP